jgi:hypothetical protein
VGILTGFKTMVRAVKAIVIAMALGFIPCIRICYQW